MLLDKSAILEADDLKYEDVDVPEWGGTVRVRCLTAADRYALLDASLGQDGTINRQRFVLGILAAAIVNESGERLFTDVEVERLATKSYMALDRLVPVANRLNGLGGEQDVIEKN